MFPSKRYLVQGKHWQELVAGYIATRSRHDVTLIRTPQTTPMHSNITFSVWSIQIFRKRRSPVTLGVYSPNLGTQDPA